MCVAGALRGSAASTTATDRRALPNATAPERPAGPPPTMTTSNCGLDAVASCMRRTLANHPDTASCFAIFARRRQTSDMDIEELVSARLRSTRLALGWSLDDLAARTNVSASTISRIETGKRTISLDLLVPLCAAMQTDINVLLDTSDAEDDVVIRPVATPYHHGGTIWPLTRNRDATGIVAVKMRLEPGDVDAGVVRAGCARRP